jgi:cytochrome c5
MSWSALNMPKRLILWILRYSSALLPLALLSVMSCNDTRRGETNHEQRLDPTTQDQLLLASAKVALPPPGIAPTDLPDSKSDGARLLQQYCTACHELPTPLTHSATDWPSVTRRMWLRIDGLVGNYSVAVPTSAERVLILQYLIDNALNMSRVALPPGPNRVSFAETCSRCHELPDPRLYGYEDWIAVVQRMTARMQTMLGHAVTQEEYSNIVRYLEAVARTTP